MPAAPSYERLLDTQSIFETALAAYVSAGGLDPVYTSRGAADMKDSRVEVLYTPGASTGHQTPRPVSGTGEPELDMHTGIIAFSVRTDRAIVAASPVEGFATLHDYRVARLKTLMMRGAINGRVAGISALSIPWHRITVQGFSGQHSLVEEDVYDVTELAWSVMVQILPDAWPAPAAP